MQNASTKALQEHFFTRQEGRKEGFRCKLRALEYLMQKFWPCAWRDISLPLFADAAATATVSVSFSCELWLEQDCGSVRERTTELKAIEFSSSQHNKLKGVEDCKTN